MAQIGVNFKDLLNKGATDRCIVKKTKKYWKSVKNVAIVEF